ncbi:MAG: hypothetical protein WBB34_12205 [Xanthobacteraceae bacterium]
MEKHISLSTWRDSFYWLGRGKFTSQLKLAGIILSFIIIAVLAPYVFSPLHSTILAAACCAGMLLYLGRSRYFSERIRRSFGDAVTCRYSHVATPFTTMFEALAEQKVRLRDISRLTVETGKFSNLLHYVNGDGKVLMRLANSNPDAAIHIYGFGLHPVPQTPS